MSKIQQIFNFKILIEKKLFIFTLIISLFINIFIWAFLFLKIKAQSNPIPLHYNIYFGIDLIGKWYKIFLIPLLGLIIFFINFIVSSIIYSREKILSYYLAIITVFIQIILVLSSVFISLQIL